jgi:putative DNA primase/helicase
MKPGTSERGIQTLADGYTSDDVGNADRFVTHFGADVRYTKEWGWVVWDGKRWTRDTLDRVRLYAQQLRDHVVRDALEVENRDAGNSLLAHAAKLGSTRHINSMLTEAAPKCPASTIEFDRDPWLLNCDNGVLDLRTGTLKPHDRSLLISKLAPVSYDPDATCPYWRMFVYRIMAGNVDLINFLQRALGYSISGNTQEQAMFLMYGTGGNGKSTLWGAIAHILGDYALNIRVATILRKERENSSAASGDIARLIGARYVTASEPDMGKSLDVGIVKDLTGSDPITARFLYKEDFQFMPELKLWLSTNHKPVIRDTTNAIWRRLNLIPFTVTFTDQDRDPNLSDKLRKEAPGILAWLVEGCRKWQDTGLRPPETVRAASDAYRKEMDVLAPFIAECCIRGNASVYVLHKDLYKAYSSWCLDMGERPLGRNNFADMLRERGYKDGYDDDKRLTWYCIGLTAT